MDKEILEEFISESKQIVTNCLELLETIEGNYSKVGLLEHYGNNLDRIMGGASTIGLDEGEDHVLKLITDYATLCKNVGYKASQIKVNESFFDVCVGFLVDATEVLQLVLDHFDKPTSEIKDMIPEEFINRLKWVLRQFSSQVRSTVETKSPTQNPLDKSLKSFSELDMILNRITTKMPKASS